MCFIWAYNVFKERRIDLARAKQNSERIAVFFSPEILQRLKDEAKTKGVSVSALVRMIVMERYRREEK